MSKRIPSGERSMCGQCCWQNSVQGINYLFASLSPEEYHCTEECHKMESEVSNKREQRKGLNRTPQKQSWQYDYPKTNLSGEC